MNPFLKADELTRRQFVSNAARAYLGVHLFPMLGGTLASAAPATAVKGGTAKSVIYLYMSGGMSHLDTFDPKPKNKDVMGKTEAIPTKVDGVMLGNYLPKTAGVMDKVCVINSMNSTQGAHEQGAYIMHTSYSLRGTIKHPSLGAWAVKLGGRIHPELPGFVAINSSPEHVGGGFFGAKYSAALIGSPDDGLQDSKRADAVSAEDFDRRLSLADRMNSQFHSRYPNADVKAYEELYREAIALMKSKDLNAFDLSQESAATRALYGSGRFAQGCLLARRLVENGVRFVEVQLGGWDTHVDNFTAVAGRCKEFDQAYAALITDLDKVRKTQGHARRRRHRVRPLAGNQNRAQGRPRPPPAGVLLPARRRRHQGRRETRPHRRLRRQGQGRPRQRAGFQRHHRPRSRASLRHHRHVAHQAPLQDRRQGSARHRAFRLSPGRFIHPASSAG